MSVQYKIRDPHAPTSAAQGGYIRSLALRLGESVTVPALKGDASKMIEDLKARLAAAPVAAAPAAFAPVEVGMYDVPGLGILRVQKSRESGKNYAKRLVVTGPGRAHLEYARGAMANIRPQHRMTLEQAQAVGVMYGICAVCAAELTDPKSVERGIGPVCARRV